MDWNWGHSGWGFIAMAFFWAGVLALAVWGIHAFRSSAPPADPRRILDERFARGEVSEKEYRQRKAVLDEGAR